MKKMLCLLMSFAIVNVVMADNINEKVQSLKKCVDSKKYNDALELLRDIRFEIEQVIAINEKSDAIIVDVISLMGELDNNTLKANSKYRNKIIQIDGYITSIDHDEYLDENIEPQKKIKVVMGDNFSIKCLFDLSKENILTDYIRGQHVRITGSYIKGDKYNVLIDNCSIRNIEKNR